MNTIGIIDSIDLNGLKNYILSQEEYVPLFTQEQQIFDQLYEAKIFPNYMKVRYDYSSGYYDAEYGSDQHKYKCKDLFRDFFKMWEPGNCNSCNPDFTNSKNLKLFANLKDLYEYALTYGQPLQYVYKSEFGYYITAPSMNVFVPTQFIQATPYRDYSDIPVGRIGINEAVSKNLPDIGGETQHSIQEKLRKKQEELAAKMEETQAKEDEQAAEIQRMKLAIEEKYRKTFEMMENKKAELKEMMQQLQSQLFIIDTQIYGIRCFFGETVKFTQIAKGNNAPIEDPVVMYQRIRFLDEELAKYVALYEFDGADTILFEELLKTRKDMMDLFFPEGKSICLVRISRDKLFYKSDYSSEVDNGNVSIYNVMERYEVLHGDRIAILVRNGDNCYIGWTEEERINLSDGNAFLTPKKSEIADEAEVKKDFHGNIIEDKTDKREVAARYFIFSIAQGLIENSKLLELPVGANVTQSSPYVVFSMADNWLSDNTYGSYDDIIEKCDVNLRKGDNILTLRGLHPEGTVYSRYCNDRGRGYNNRTHDVSASDNTIYPINLVEADPKRNIVAYNWKQKGSGTNWYSSKWNTSATEEEYLDDFWNHHDDRSYEYKDIRFLGPAKHVFISLVKDSWRWSNTESRANFELFSDEYINLTFLNTVYLKYIIINRKMPKRHISGDRNFSSLLPYLNKAMEFLKNREIIERKTISKYTQLQANWQVELTEWKLKHNVHEITDYQAKRFSKWYATASQ